MMNEKCPVNMSEKVEESIRLLQELEIPNDFEKVESEEFLQNVAFIRHRFTNYEDLLFELTQLCVKHWETGFQCPWNGDCECEYAQEAHDMLKQAGKKIAMCIIETHFDKIFIR